MANSYVEYENQISGLVFNKGYLDKSHVVAFLDGTEVGFTWIDGETIDINTDGLTVPDSYTVRVQRKTPSDERLVDWTDGSSLNGDIHNKIKK